MLQAAQKDPKTGKTRKRNPAGPFADLTWEQQRVAEQWLWKFCKRWEGNLPPWRRAILTGVAKRLAVNPLSPAEALSLLRTRGGNALARRVCREHISHPGIVAMHRGLARKRARIAVSSVSQLAV